MISLHKIYTLLFLLGIFFIPFNEFDGLSFLGEYKDEAATYFFLLGFFFVVSESFVSKKISFPYKNTLIVLLAVFIVWTFITILLNIDTVKISFYKQTTGISRYVRQSFSLLISAVCFPVLFWNVIKKYTVNEIILKVRKVIFYSFLFVTVYGIIEIGIVYFGASFLKPVLGLFEYFPFVNNYLHVKGRIGISSVTFEIPALGNFLIFVAPWMFSYIITERGFLKYLPSVAVIILMLFSNARAAFIVVLFQMLCFLILLWYDDRFRSTVVLGLRSVATVLLIVVLFKSETIYNTVYEKIDTVNFSKNLTQNVSNKSRFGMQSAALEVFKENPVFGVGFGQGTYHMVKYYPYWATTKNWEFKYFYKNQQDKSFPPQFNIYTRLLAETGFIGALLFVLLVTLPIYYALIFWKKTPFKTKYIGVILLLSFIGFAINWLQIDFFRQYGFWLVLVLLIRTTQKFNKKQENLNTNINYVKHQNG